MSSELTLPRKKISSVDNKLYRSLGSLIKDYRQWKNISQETFAESIRISVRELQNWESERRRARIENLHDISESTGIPMQALVALNADQPIWYSLRKRFFTYSLIEKAQFSSQEIFVSDKKPEDHTLIKTATITSEKHIDMILSCHRDLYGTKIPLQKDIIRAATAIVPELNIIIFDSWGHYVAHRICLPIETAVYQELKKQINLEKFLTSKMISDITTRGKGVFFLYSTFSNNVSMAYRLTSGDIRVLSKIKQKERYMLASHTVTKESAIIQKNLNMKFVRAFADKNDEVFPVIYEIKLDFLLRQDGPFGWMVEPVDDKSLYKHQSIKTQQKKLPKLLVQDPDKCIHPIENCQPANIPEVKSPIIVGNKDRALTKGNSQYIKSRTETCTNPKCTLYNKIGKGNIISNGTYRTKKGTPGRRFQCKKCGKSFCSRTKTIFYDLRSPEEKVFNALKLLAKGMPLQHAAKFLGVKFDTIRRWLEVAAAKSEQIDAFLIKEPDISQTDLDLLWTFVKTKSLRQRAFIARAKYNPNTSE